MKKWLIVSFVLIVIMSAYISSSIFNSLNEPVFCANCHIKEYQNYLFAPITSDLPLHKKNNIKCLDCHSSSGVQSNIATKEVLIKAQIINYSLPHINKLLSSNFTFNQSFNVSDFSIFRPNCIKCHDINEISSSKFLNHSNTSNITKCENCHFLHQVTEKNESDYKKLPVLSFWRNIGEGGHKNRTCGDCHGTDIMKLSNLPQCMKCHIPHLKNATWDRSICLGCHENPHLPVRNGTFKTTATKEMCSACHDKIYKTLTIFNSKHNNKVPACINCHPKHRVKLKCTNCHLPHSQYHPGGDCAGCHNNVDSCTRCHTNPHAPLSNLPIITTKEQLIEYAIEVGKKKT